MREPEITIYQRAFSLVCGVRVDIDATPARIWRILTDAKDFSRWNSTVKSIEGEIRDGGSLKMRIPGSTDVFTVTVSGVVPDERMVWRTGFPAIFKSVRRFVVLRLYDGRTSFWMTERFSGLLVAFSKSSLTRFGPTFSRFATDLRFESERPAQSMHLQPSELNSKETPGTT